MVRRVNAASSGVILEQLCAGNDDGTVGASVVELPNIKANGLKVGWSHALMDVLNIHLRVAVACLHKEIDLSRDTVDGESVGADVRASRSLLRRRLNSTPLVPAKRTTSPSRASTICSSIGHGAY